MPFTIGQLAKLTGLTVRALHHYDAIGLLVPSQRTGAGYRLYANEEVARLFRIQLLQSVGLTLTEIGDVLRRDGAPLPDLIAQQLALLDEQLEHGLALRRQLVQLQDALRGGDQPSAADWIAGIDLIAQYGKYCSSAELGQLIEHRNDNADAWRELIEDWRYALEKGVDAHGGFAQSLLSRWSELFLQRVGGDATLAAKLKTAYAEDLAVQHRMAVQSGITAAMLEFLGKAMSHAHRTAWAKHFDSKLVSKLQLGEPWQNKLLPVVAALGKAANADESATRDDALRQWNDLLAHVAQNAPAVQSKIEAALLTDDELARLWLLSDRARDWLSRDRRAAPANVHGAARIQ